MKNQSTARPSAVSAEPEEADIRDYAYHLYLQSGSMPGHDVENWLEATACLKANIPPHRSHSRLHYHHVTQAENAQLQETAI